jgi:hypothetical protein
VDALDHTRSFMSFSLPGFFPVERDQNRRSEVGLSNYEQEVIDGSITL